MAINNTSDRITSVKHATGQSGPFHAKIVGHVDETYMGSLRVQLLKKTIPGPEGELNKVGGSQVLTARYMSPFGGTTPIDSINDNPGYTNSQQSYGMWMVPPDLGTIVLVILIEGNPNDCYWIGCVHDRFANFAVPGNAATTYLADDRPEELKGKKLPVAEYNKKLLKTEWVSLQSLKNRINKDLQKT